MLAIFSKVLYFAGTFNFEILNPFFMYRQPKKSSINIFRLKQLAGTALVMCLFVVGLVV
jgi:hypothetical protein